jgi:glycosyltransferase involved in cell wall biosynthesis
MVSFREKLEHGLAARKIEVARDLDDTPYQAILVIGGTRQIPQLWRAKRKGIRIVQRLDGMNWLHRLRRTSARHFIRAEYSNWLLSFIRSRLADWIVYQSRFSQAWWERVHGRAPASSTIVYNGVVLSAYTPSGAGSLPNDFYRLLMVEGSLMGGYEMGLEMAVNLGEGLDARLKAAHSLSLEARPVELMIVGRVEESVKQRWQADPHISIVWAGLVGQDRIPEIDRTAHLLYSADIHPACPNSVIEALACGLPVLAYDTGALSELVPVSSGCIVPYGGDPWRLESPDNDTLVNGAVRILQNQEGYRRNARLHAEQAFDLENMVQEYLHVLLDT